MPEFAVLENHSKVLAYDINFNDEKAFESCKPQKLIDLGTPNKQKVKNRIPINACLTINERLSHHSTVLPQTNDFLNLLL